MLARTRKRERRALGYVISVELLLIFAILVLGSVVGVIAVRDALFRRVEAHRAAQLTVKDSTAPDPLLFGRPVNYDLCEAPQILCPDAGFDENNNGAMATPGATQGLRALVGIRPDRFVTRNQIYFTGDNCTGDAYIAPPPVPGSPNFLPTLAVGYFNCGIQVDSGGDPVCYGAGPPVGWGAAAACDDVTDLPCTTGGRLYRSDGTTTSTPSITSRWISLNPDCALEGSVGGGGATPNLVANPSFEAPVLADGAFVGAVGAPWALAGAGGTFNPLATGPGPPDPPFDGPHFSPGAPPSGLPTQNVPDGVNTFFSNGGAVTQPVAGLVPGGSCTLSVWIGRRADYVTPPFGASVPFLVTLAGHPAATLAGSVTAASPEWAEVSATFTAVGAGPFALAVAAGGTQVNFDLVSLTCGAAAAGGTTEICDDAFDTTTVDLLPAIEVTDMAGANVLAPYAPLFNVMAPMAPAFGTIAPEPEETPAMPPPSNQIAPEPEGG